MAKVVKTEAGATTYTIEFSQEEVNYLASLLGLTFVDGDDFPEIKALDMALVHLFSDRETDTPSFNYWEGELTYEGPLDED